MFFMAADISRRLGFETSSCMAAMGELENLKGDTLCNKGNYVPKTFQEKEHDLGGRLRKIVARLFPEGEHLRPG